ncbi:MAG TPA: DUF2089 domain-containing protein [Thermomicrobiales bacterium]|nr:DUF2089 domain-containing protein [Thermomicrobiales bacterium]
MPTRISECPSCHGNLEIRELYCPACDIQLRGRFDPAERSPFALLNEEQEAFLRLFVLSRGNLSDVERALGVSYPTVRAKLDDLIAAVTAGEEAMSAAPAQPAATAASSAPTNATRERDLTRSEILARVADGRLSTEDGMAMLKQLASGS